MPKATTCKLDGQIVGRCDYETKPISGAGRTRRSAVVNATSSFDRTRKVRRIKQLTSNTGKSVLDAPWEHSDAKTLLYLLGTCRFRTSRSRVRLAQKDRRDYCSRRSEVSL
jgi:hypothetical protein